MKPLDESSLIADLGCGTGGQTKLLARHLPGTIVGVDLLPEFIEAFDASMRAEHLERRVRGIVGSMDDLPFERRSLDLVWSEGAVDGVGFEKCLAHWRPFLKEGGFVAVSCPSWLTGEHPDTVERFWADAGSHLDDVASNIAVMQACGYRFVASFTLPETCWTDNYFAPRAQRCAEVLERYRDSDIAHEYAEQNRYETELYAKYSRHYGYVFYIGEVLDADGAPSTLL